MPEVRCLSLNWSPWAPFLVNRKKYVYPGSNPFDLPWMPVWVWCKLSSEVPVPSHWLSRKPVVICSCPSISFSDAQRKTCLSVGHLGPVEQQPLIYRVEACFVILASFMNQLLGELYSRVVEAVCVWKEDLRISLSFLWGHICRQGWAKCCCYSGIKSQQSHRFSWNCNALHVKNKRRNEKEFRKN